MGDEKPTTLQVLLPLAPLISATAAAVAAVVSCSGFFYSRLTDEARREASSALPSLVHVGLICDFCGDFRSARSGPLREPTPNI